MAINATPPSKSVSYGGPRPKAKKKVGGNEDFAWLKVSLMKVT